MKRIRFLLIGLAIAIPLFIFGQDSTAVDPGNGNSIELPTDPLGWPAIVSYILNILFLIIKPTQMAKILSVINKKGAALYEFTYAAVQVLSDRQVTPEELIELRDKGRAILAKEPNPGIP